MVGWSVGWLFGSLFVLQKKLRTFKKKHCINLETQKEKCRKKRKNPKNIKAPLLPKTLKTQCIPESHKNPNNKT
jgi:hypothetical protein